MNIAFGNYLQLASQKTTTKMTLKCSFNSSLKRDSNHRRSKDSYLNLLFINPLSHHGWLTHQILSRQLTDMNLKEIEKFNSQNAKKD